MNSSSQTLQHQAEEFFTRYGREFDAADWDAFRANYSEPAFSVRADGGIAILEDINAVGKFFRNVWSKWREEGYSRFTISGLTASPIGGASAMVTFTWHLLRADGTQIREWNQSYQLVRAGDGWKVLSSTFHKAAN